jgi:hypothetical protein
LGAAVSEAGFVGLQLELFFADGADFDGERHFGSVVITSWPASPRPVVDTAPTLSKCDKVFETGRLGLDYLGCLHMNSGARYPLPTKGYFGRKILVIMGLQRVCVCKIFIPDELRLKYC